MTRRHGFQRPWTIEQIGTWITMPIAVSIYYLVVVIFVFGTARLPLLVIYSVCSLVLIVFWLHCSLADPQIESGPYWPCMKEAQKTSRYCASCRKMIPGLDHHCAWLNTCVGRRQYPSFFIVVMTGSAMLWLETVIIILLLTEWYDPVRAVNIVSSEVVYKTLLGVSAAFVGALASAVSVLAIFHTFLQFVGMGTYAYILDGRQREIDRARTRRIKREGEKKKQHQSSSYPQDNRNCFFPCCKSTSNISLEPKSAIQNDEISSGLTEEEKTKTMIASNVSVNGSDFGNIL